MVTEEESEVNFTVSCNEINSLVNRVSKSE